MRLAAGFVAPHAPRSSAQPTSLPRGTALGVRRVFQAEAKGKLCWPLDTEGRRAAVPSSMGSSLRPCPLAQLGELWYSRLALGGLLSRDRSPQVREGSAESQPHVAPGRQRLPSSPSEGTHSRSCPLLAACPSGLEGHSRPLPGLQGAPDPSQGSAPSCPDSPDNLDVLQTRRSRHVRKRRRLQ